MQLTGKVAVITGGGSGIGEAIAYLFASEGANVVVVDLHGAEAESVAQALRVKYGMETAISIQADVAIEDQVQEMMRTVRRLYGKLDVLVNNAATILPKSLEHIEELEWDRLLAVNLKSVYLTIKHSIDDLRSTKGSIVNMSSLNGLVGQKMNAAYAATKGAVIALTKSLAIDYAADGVRVNCICPAGVMTPLLEKWIMQQPDAAQTKQALNDMHQLGRPAYPNEIAKAALFLGSDQSSFITGVALPVEGGASLGY